MAVALEASKEKSYSMFLLLATATGFVEAELDSRYISETDELESNGVDMVAPSETLGESKKRQTEVELVGPTSAQPELVALEN